MSPASRVCKHDSINTGEFREAAPRPSPTREVWERRALRVSLVSLVGCFEWERAWQDGEEGRTGAGQVDVAMRPGSVVSELCGHRGGHVSLSLSFPICKMRRHENQLSASFHLGLAFLLVSHT